MKLLINKGANVNQADRNGETLLMNAALNGEANIISHVSFQYRFLSSNSNMISCNFPQEMRIL